MITVEFIWDDGDPSVGLWAGWEACYAVIEQGEGIRTLVSFEPVENVPVHLWAIEEIETQHYWTEPCDKCEGTGRRTFPEGHSGGCLSCRHTGVVERISTLCINLFEGETRQMMRRLSEIPPVAVAVRREWDRITMLDAIRYHEENAALASEYADSLISSAGVQVPISPGWPEARQEAEAARDKYSAARKRYESIYGDLEEACK